jgi:uncharacterized membrane protein
MTDEEIIEKLREFVPKHPSQDSPRMKKIREKFRAISEKMKEYDLNKVMTI